MLLRLRHKLFPLLSIAFATNSACAADLKSESIFSVFGLPVTNLMLTTWIFTIIIIALFRLLIGGRAKLIPSKGQIAVETIIDGLRGIFEPLMGKAAFKGAFPLLLGFFAYILVMNWSGLLPGAGSIGEERIAEVAPAQTAEFAAAGFKPAVHAAVETAGQGMTLMEKFVPFIRPANSDLNTTLALSIISFVAWIYFVWKYAGPKAFLHETFGNKADKNEVPFFIYVSLFFVFFAVGCIDVISILMRLLSLSFRLYGNNFGGEVLLENMHEIAIGLPRFVSWIIPIPFYLLEILIGFIQAFLFSLLTAVYIGLLTGHQED